MSCAELCLEDTASRLQFTSIRHRVFHIHSIGFVLVSSTTFLLGRHEFRVTHQTQDSLLENAQQLVIGLVLGETVPWSLGPFPSYSETQWLLEVEPTTLNLIKSIVHVLKSDTMTDSIWRMAESTSPGGSISGLNQ